MKSLNFKNVIKIRERKSFVVLTVEICRYMILLQ